MKLNMQHAHEFLRIIQTTELKAEEINSEGLFQFGRKTETGDTHVNLDPGVVAGLIQLKKSVERGQSPEDQLVKSVEQIRKELNL